MAQILLHRRCMDIAGIAQRPRGRAHDLLEYSGTLSNARILTIDFPQATSVSQSRRITLLSLLPVLGLPS